VISAREFLQLRKIWPRVMDLLFFVLGRECMRVVVGTVVYVCGL
jgi:hypothetical protein